MTREEFTKRLEEVGFKYINMCHTYDFATNNKYYQVHLADNKDIFIVPERSSYEIYFFDELEQFLIDNGIVEKPFNAHEYLLSRGFKEECSGDNQLSAYFIPKSNVPIAILIDKKNLKYDGKCIRVVDFYTWKDIWVFKGITKQSIDKAIKLIDFLTELEKE